MQLFGSTTWSAAWDSPISRCHRPSDGSRAAVHVPRGSRWAITAAVSSTAVSVVKSQSRASKMKRKRNWEDFNAAAELGDVALTKEIFWEMQSWIPMSKQRMAFNTVLKACANAADLRAAEEWYDFLLEKGLVPNKETYGKLSEAAAKAGKTEEAQKWFMEREKRQLEITPIAMNILIDASAKSGEGVKAENHLQDMRRRNIAPTVSSFNTVIHACARVGASHEAEKYLLEMQREQLKPTLFSFSSVIDSCAKSGEIERAEHWLQELQRCDLVPNVVTYTALIDAYARVGNARRSEEILRLMTREGVEPSEVSYSCVMNAYAGNADEFNCVRLFQEMCQRELKPTMTTYSIMMKCAAFSGDFPTTKSWFERLEAEGEPDLPSYNIVLCAIANAATSSRTMEPALDWMRQLEAHGFQPDITSFNALISGYAQMADVDGALEAFKKMIQRKISPNSVSYKIVWHAHQRAGDVARAGKWLERMIADGFSPRLGPFTWMIQQSQGDEAVKWLQKLQSARYAPDVLCYSNCIQACGAAGDFKQAKRIFEQMNQQGIQPDEICFNEIIRIHAKQQAPEKAKEILTTQMRERQLAPTVVNFNSTMDACAKGASPQLAETVLDEMLQCHLSPDVFSYSALSSAWAKKGDAVKATEVLSAMAVRRLVPNQHVYGAAIHACNRSRDAVLATKLLQRMSEESVKPNVVCFSSAICACAKVGDAAEAENLFTAMPVRNLQPNAFTYAAVVHAHCVAGNIEAAWQRLGDMRSANLPITSATLRPFLKAGTLAGPEVLKAIFEGMLQSGLPIDDAFRKGVMSVVGVEVTYGLLRRYNRIDD